jgi:ribosome-associated protein
VVSNFSRSQHANRERAESRLAELIRGALAVRRPRKKTAPGKTAVERRLKEKKQHSEKKKARRINTDE